MGPTGPVLCRLLGTWGGLTWVTSPFLTGGQGKENFALPDCVRWDGRGRPFGSGRGVESLRPSPVVARRWPPCRDLSASCKNLSSPCQPPGRNVPVAPGTWGSFCALSSACLKWGACICMYISHFPTQRERLGTRMRPW